MGAPAATEITCQPFILSQVHPTHFLDSIHNLVG